MDYCESKKAEPQKEKKKSFHVRVPVLHKMVLIVLPDEYVLSSYHS